MQLLKTTLFMHLGKAHDKTSISHLDCGLSDKHYTLLGQTWSSTLVKTCIPTSKPDQPKLPVITSGLQNTAGRAALPEWDPLENAASRHAVGRSQCWHDTKHVILVSTKPEPCFLRMRKPHNFFFFLLYKSETHI